MKKKLTTIVASAVSFTASFAQMNVTSPTATEFVRYERIPVSYFNGLPQIGIPLYTVDYDDLHLPISLSYHASGIKVNQYPTPVGLGWTLNSGGAIVRVVNGMPDEYSSKDAGERSGIYGNYNPGYYYTSQLLDRNDWMLEPGMDEFQRFYVSDSDFEPDEFVINAYGVSGSVYFFQDASGHIKSRIKSNNGETFKVLPPAVKRNNNGDIAIKFTSSTVGYPLKSYRVHELFYEFTVIKQDGTQLIFGGNNDCIEFYTEKVHGHDGPHLKTWPSAWMLRKVVSPKGNTIKFDYLRDGSPLIMSDVRTDVTVYDETGGSGIFPSHHPDRGKSFVVQHPLYPKSITVGNILKINFLTSRNNDVPTITENDREYLKLSEFDMALNNKDGVCFENGSTLNTDYSPHNYSMHLTRMSVEYEKTWLKSYYFTYVQGKDERLKLSKLSVRDNSGHNEQIFSFSYNSGKLPQYNSTVTDNWGYWNNKNYRNTSVGSNFFNYRSSSLYYAKAESLTGITYPTGGRVAFEYELNDYSKVATQVPDFEIKSSSGMAGGLRIKRITYITDSTSYSHSFEYKNEDGTSSGILSGTPRYIAEGSEHTQIKCSGWDGLVYFKVQEDIEQRYKMVSESYVNSLGLTTGNHITYSRVKEYIGGTSPLTKEYRYTNHDNRPDTSDYAMYTNIDDVALYNKFTSRATERGLLTDEIWYSDGHKVKEINYTYNSNPSRFDNFVKCVDRFKVNGANMQYNLPFLRFAPYKILTYYPYLESRTEKLYSHDSHAEISTTKESYRYNSNLQTVRTVIFDPVYGSKTTTITYPDNYIGSPFSEMLDEGIVDAPVERVEYISGKLTGATLTEYKPANGIFVPFKQWVVHLEDASDSSSFVNSINGVPSDLRYSLDKEVLYADDFGNPLVLRNSNGITTFYSWDAGQPLCIVHNGEISETTGSDGFFYENFEKGGLNTYPFGYHSGHCAVSPIIARIPGNSSSYFYLDYWVYKKGKWEYVRKKVSNPEYLIDEGLCPIDEIRMWPIGTDIETYTWTQPFVLRSRTGADGATESYCYDGSMRLSGVVNNDGCIVKEYEYNRVSQFMDGYTPLYYNEEISLCFENSNCDREHGCIPIPIMYTVPANFIYSSKSIEDANRKAFGETLTKGQEYADEYGKCPAVSDVVSVSVYNYTGKVCKLSLDLWDDDSDEPKSLFYFIPPDIRSVIYLEKYFFTKVSAMADDGSRLQLSAASGRHSYFQYKADDTQDMYIITQNN